LARFVEILPIIGPGTAGALEGNGPDGSAVGGPAAVALVSGGGRRLPTPVELGDGERPLPSVTGKPTPSAVSE